MLGWFSILLRIDLEFDWVVMMVTLMFLEERAFERSTNGRVWPSAMKGKTTIWGINGGSIYNQRVLFLLLSLPMPLSVMSRLLSCVPQYIHNIVRRLRSDLIICR